jgi:hypothetical protein
MADITKCCNGDCPLKLNCHRFTAITGENQSWQKFECFLAFNKGCDYPVYDCEYYIKSKRKNFEGVN